MVTVNKQTANFKNLTTSCSHRMSNNANLADSSLSELDRQYLAKLLQVVGGSDSVLLDLVGGLMYNFDNSWSSRDIFFNCYDRPANWTQFKADLAARRIDIPKLVGDELNRRGVVVNFVKDSAAPVFNEVSYPALAAAANAAVNSGNGVTSAFGALAQAHNFGNLDDDIKTFINSPENDGPLRDSVRMLNYVIPTSNDAVDLMKMKQIYWGAYYLKQFPIPSSLLGNNCGQISQTLIQLSAEKANLKQNDLDQLYSIFSEADLEQKMQVVSDLTTKFNGLYAQQNCTAAQADGGGDVMKYVLMGIAGVFLVVIGYKIVKRNKS